MLLVASCFVYFWLRYWKKHTYLKSTWRKVSVKMAASYSTDPFPLCVMNMPLLGLQWGDDVAASNSF